MKITELKCNNCGSPLPTQFGFCTCEKCGSNYYIERDTQSEYVYTYNISSRSGISFLNENSYFWHGDNDIKW